MQGPIRVLIAKPGLDGHDRGALVVAQGLRDEGMEVIYTGLRQTPAQIVATAIEEDVACVGLSSLSGAHMTLFPEVLRGLKEAGASDILLIGGGVIPEQDAKALKNMGVAEIFTPGSSIKDMADYIRQHAHLEELTAEPVPVSNVDHIGIAVRNLDESIAFYGQTYGLMCTGREIVEDQGVEVAFLSAGNLHIELLSPTKDDSGVAKFLGARGPGVHHMAFAVPNIEQALDNARNQGLKLIDETSRLGAGNKRIAFVHPKSTDGVLTEFCESLEKGGH